MPKKITTVDNRLIVDVQNPYHFHNLPDKKIIQYWAETAYLSQSDTSITLRFVDEDEGLTLNQEYRAKAYATNILSFCFDPPILPEGVILDIPPHLGDLVICTPVIETEAHQQQKSCEQHYAHLIVHGMLHLQGYDHIEEQQAQQMETLETTLLKTLGYPDPYLDSLLKN